MVEALLLVGIGVAVFVGFNIGGSSTGVAFGPAVGSKTVSKLAAAALMTGFALLGGWTVGREVIKTMGGQIVPESQFTLAASVAVLFFVGFALLISNLFGVPASTSMTAVGAIAGLGAASGSLNMNKMGEIVSWWIVAPVAAFWLCAVIGRYFYPYLASKIDLEGDGSGTPTLKQRLGQVLVVGIGCYMAFSAGASNVANAVAPLVGSGELGIEPGIVLAGGAIGLGAFTIARRTLDTVGNDLTDLPLLAALIVEVVSASLITSHHVPLVHRYPGLAGRLGDDVHRRTRLGACHPNDDHPASGRARRQGRYRATRRRRQAGKERRCRADRRRTRWRRHAHR
jgi:PiT family inorganic phosphate transporter